MTADDMAREFFSPLTWAAGLLFAVLITAVSLIAFQSGVFVGRMDARAEMVPQYIEPVEFAKFGFKGGFAS